MYKAVSTPWVKPRVRPISWRRAPPAPCLPQAPKSGANFPAGGHGPSHRRASVLWRGGLVPGAAIAGGSHGMVGGEGTCALGLGQGGRRQGRAMVLLDWFAGGCSGSGCPAHLRGNRDERTMDFDDYVAARGGGSTPLRLRLDPRLACCRRRCSIRACGGISALATHFPHRTP
jgi:hypothetical protein